MVQLPFILFLNKGNKKPINQHIIIEMVQQRFTSKKIACGRNVLFEIPIALIKFLTVLCGRSFEGGAD